MKVFMDEIKLLLNCEKANMAYGLSPKRILKRFSLFFTAELETLVRSRAKK